MELWDGEQAYCTAAKAYRKGLWLDFLKFYMMDSVGHLPKRVIFVQSGDFTEYHVIKKNIFIKKTQFFFI